MPQLEQINATTYKIASGRDAIEVGNIDDAQCLAHLKVKRWHGNSSFMLSYPGLPTGLAMVDIAKGTLTIEYGDVDVELTAHDPDGENPDGRSEFNLILNRKPTPDANGEYWQLLDFEAVGINLSRVLGLDEEWSQERCYEEWYADLYDNHQGNDLYGHDNGTGIFVRTPIEIRTPDGEVVLKSKPEHLVHSIRGKAVKNNHYKSELGEVKAPDSPFKGKQLSYTRVSRDHLELPRRELEDRRGKRARIEDIQLEGNQIKFKLPKDFIDKAKYPVSHVTGLDPAYTEDMDSWVTGGYSDTDNTWSDYDIYTEKGTLKNSVAEIIIANQESGVEADLGIRTDGSTLQRKLESHEAEGGGVTTYRQFVLVDASTGLVETYADDVSDENIFYLVGYWENVGYSEGYALEQGIPTTDWDDEVLNESGAANRICNMVMGSSGGDVNVGTRANGSSLERKILFHETEFGGYSLVDMLVKADANYTIEIYLDSFAAIWYMGCFGAEMDFVELFQSITNDGDSDWDALDLTAYLDEDGRVCDFLLTHNDIAAPHNLGVRDGDDAATARYIQEHEAEDDGGSTGEVTGFGISAQSNASGVVNLYSDTASEVFYLMGYFKPGVVVQDYPISLSPGLTVSATVAYKAAWDRTISPDLTVATTIARALAYNRASSSGLTVAVTIVKVLGRLITTTANLTVSTIISRAVTYTRATTAGLTAAATVVKGWGRTKATTANLTVSATIAMSKGFVRSLSLGLTVSSTVARALAYKRATTSGLTASATVDRTVAYHRFTGLSIFGYCNTGDLDYIELWGVNWVSQTFTPSEAHKITSVKLLIYRVGSPGTVTVSIQGVDGSDHPDMSDLCSGTTDGDTLTDDSGGEWREVTLGAGANLSADTKYAIVVRALGGDAEKHIHWRETYPYTSYVGGCQEWSNDSGSSWNTAADYDCMFEEWGIARTANLAISTTIARSLGRIITTSPGLTISATVVKSWGRTITTSTALAVSATVSRVVAFARSLTPGLTASITVDREVAYNRATSPGLTAAVIVVKSFGKKIATSTALAISATVDRTVAYKRATQSALSVSATVVKSWGRKITTSAGLTVSTTISRVIAYKRVTTPGLTVSTTINRIAAYKRAITSGLTVAVTVVKSLGKIITTASNLAVSTTISRVVAYRRAVSAGLTIATTIIATLVTAHHYFITVVSNLTVSTAVNRVVAYKRAVLSNLAVSTIISRAVAYKRAVSSGLTVAVTIVKSWGRTITTATNLTVSTTIARIVAYKRAIQPALSVAVTVLRSLARTIITSPALSVSTTITRSMSYKRATSVGLTVVAIISRIVAYKRTISSGLTATVTISRLFNKKITTATNLTVSVTIRYCTVLKGLYRLSTDALDTVRLTVGRMAASRLPLGRLNFWRRRRKCE